MNELYDLIIIGGGVSGVFAALSCDNLKTLLIEKNDDILNKFMITGKGKSNITNTCNNDVFIKNLIDSNKFLYPALHKYNSKNILELLNKMKINYYYKEKNRVHLLDNNSTFRRKIKNILSLNKNLLIKNNEYLIDLNQENDIFRVITNKGNYIAKNLIIATGGLSYKTTGSTGIGYDIAKKFNIKINEIYPIGVGLHYLIPKELQGKTMDNVSVEVWYENKKIYSESGSLMFTHYGFGGPVIRRVSGYITKRLLDHESCNITISFFNKDITMEELNNKHFISQCFKDVKREIVSWIVGSNDDIDLKNIKKEHKDMIIKNICNHPFIIKKTENIDFAINTGGGVDLNELNPNTYESKKIKKLFFIGEVIDLNPRTNGFNITTCYATANKCMDYIKETNK